jgi:hypothetical protein
MTQDTPLTPQDFILPDSMWMLKEKVFSAKRGFHKEMLQTKEISVGYVLDLFDKWLNIPPFWMNTATNQEAAQPSKSLKCLICGKPMKNAIDSKTGRISPYLWQTTCEHSKDKIISKG